ncbi:PD40 domain-containing protein [Chloroflexus sp. Y-396-1]|uniref:TolB family protein n=1 Tax=Chloroflexus sp. Y-396-1 TaxID=867845 RepID=UPI0004B8893C|nr:PD40 domain-containing protein [Chloroflexus sp. Y-396-1]
MNRLIPYLLFVLVCGLISIGFGRSSAVFASSFNLSPVRTTSHNHTPAQTTSSNLLQDSGFEQQGVAWEACGNVGLVDAQSEGAEFVYAGRYAIVMGISADGSDCPQLPNNSVPKQILSQSLSIPANARAVTVSFWFRGFAGTSVDIFLARGFYQFDPDLGGVKLGSFSTDQPPGWQLYRTVLTDDRLDLVRGQTLRFSIVIQGDVPVERDAALLIDEVQVVAADLRTAPAPLPPALRGDGSRPLAVIRAEGSNRWLYRMDTDGSNLQLIYRGLLNDVRYPVWSPNGQQIAVADNNTWPWPVRDPDPQNNLSATAITVLNTDGSGSRQLYQTQSQKGSRCPFVALPGQSETPSSIVRVNRLTWMPDGQRLAFTNVGFLTFCDGRISGGRADVYLSPIPPALTPTDVASFAANPSINRNRQLLFESFGNNRTTGIWEADLPSSRENLLIAHRAESQPVWAPDGRRFVVKRDTSSPSEDRSERTQAIVLYDRQNLSNPRMLLFADHGRSIDHVRWSPDGMYLVYTLHRLDGGTDIWWLDVTSGATGPITTDGRALEADWRPGSTLQRVFVPLVTRN